MVNCQFSMVRLIGWLHKGPAFFIGDRTNFGRPIANLSWLGSCFVGKMGGGMKIEKTLLALESFPFVPTAVADTEWDVDTSLDQETEEDQESLARVIIHNDDVTPMDFVVIILQRIFQLSPLEAEHVMVTAHFNGQALVTMLPLSEAKIRVGKAHFAAQLEGYPLMFTIEPV